MISKHFWKHVLMRGRNRCCRPADRYRRVRIESLESRQLLSVTGVADGSSIIGAALVADASPPDPTVQIGNGATPINAAPGDTVNVAVTITDVAAGLQSADFTVSYNTSLLDLANADVALNSDLGTAGWGIARNVDDATGTALITIYSGSSALPAGTGAQNLLHLNFHVSSTASSGNAEIDLSGHLNEGELAMTPVNGSIQVSAGAPVATGVSTTASTGSAHTSGDSIPITVTFSEPVTVSGTPQLTLNAGSGAVANYTGGSGGATLTFTYTVAAGQNAAPLDYASTTALSLNGGSIQDGASNAAVLTLPATGSDGLATKNITIDTVSPTVTSVSSTVAAGSSVGGGDSIPITITFSEPVIVSGTPLLALNAGAGAAASYTGGSGGATLTFTYTVAAGQNAAPLDYASTTALSLNGGSIQDGASNAAVLTLPATGSDGLAAKSLIVDTTVNVVTDVTTAAAAGSYHKAGDDVPITITFSEPVTVTGTPRLTLNAGNGAAADYTGGSGSTALTFTYTVATGQSVSPLDYASTAALVLNGGSIKNDQNKDANLTLPATGTDHLATKNVTIDAVAPSVAGVSSTAAAGSSHKAGDSVPIVISFSEPVTVSGTPQLALNSGSGAVAGYASGSGSTTLTFTYTVAAGQNAAPLDYSSTTALNLNGGSIQDGASNAAVLTLPTTGNDGLAAKNITIDTANPTVTGVSTTALASSQHKTGDSIAIVVTFSESVTVSGTPQLMLNAGSGAVASYTSGSESATLTFTYTVAAGQNAAPLDYASTSALSLNGGSIQDAAGNPAVLTLPTTGSDGLAAKSITIDTASPTVSSVSSTASAGALFHGGDSIPITITFSEPVTVSGAPQLALNSGTGTVAGYTSGSGTSTLTFTYTVAAGQNAAPLDYSSTTALTLNGGSIRDAAANAAVLTLSAPGSDNLVIKGLIVDTTANAVTDVTTAAAASSYYKAGDSIPIIVTFSEPVTVSGTPQLTLNSGTGAVAGYTGGSGTTALTFTYTVAAAQAASPLDYASSAAVVLNGGSIKNSLGESANLALPAIGTDHLATQNITIDTTAPVVTAVTSTKADGTYGVGIVIPITVKFSEAVLVTGTPQLALNTTPAAAVNYTSGSGSDTLEFAYTVAAGEASSRLDYASASALALNGGTIKDQAGNDANLSLASPGAAGSLAASTTIAISTAATATTSLAGVVYVDADNDGQDALVGSQRFHLGIPGVTLVLTRTDVSGEVPQTVLSGADGAYSFANLAAGTYQIQELQPLKYIDGKDTLGTVAGAIRGSMANNVFSGIVLAAGEQGREYNFGQRGVALGYISQSSFLASTPSGAGAVHQLNDAPVVQLTGTQQVSVVTLPQSGGPVSLADAAATITHADGGWLKSLIVTVTNLKDGASESLTAQPSVLGSNPRISSSYASGVLTLSGAAPLADYQQVLRTVTYADTASAPNPSPRLITFVASDGTDNSNIATAIVTMPSSVSAAAIVSAAGEVSAAVSSTVRQASLSASLVDEVFGGMLG
jgi:hypothetical protein